MLFVHIHGRMAVEPICYLCAHYFSLQKAQCAECSNVKSVRYG